MSKTSWKLVWIAAYLATYSSAQSIPPSAFIIAGNDASPLPPPPPPPASSINVGFTGQSTSPPPNTPSPPPPNAAPPSNATTAAAAGKSSSGHSGISGGAIAGIVIGALAVVALLAAFAFFLTKRRSKQSPSLPVVMSKKHNTKEAEIEGEESDILRGLPQQATSLHPANNPFNPPLLSWKPDEGVVGPSESASLPTIRSTRMSDPIQDSLTDVPLRDPRSETAHSKDSDSFMQRLSSNSTFIVSKGPGGSVNIARAPNSAETNSQASTISGRSSGIKSMVSGSSVELPDMPWSNWEVKATDIAICRDDQDEPIILGSGAYGTVYKATKDDGVTEVAVKMFHDVHNNLQQADILREVAILKACRHPNIVQFLGACIMDQKILLITELMGSGDLWHALMQYKDSGVLSWYRRGRRIASEIAQGLHHLHHNHLVHFDLKTPNVLLTRDGTAKISDVGFANILSNTHLTSGDAAFTFAWAAPEVLIGAPCSNKVDMYSFGVIMWELVTGEQPRRGMLRDIRVPEECPKEVEQLLTRCLMADPAVRPDCKEVVRVLAALEKMPPPHSRVSSGSS